MKVGILTLPFNNNYGGLLQSYALQTYLKKQGHDVLVIQRVSSQISNFQNFKNLVKKMIGFCPIIIDYSAMKEFEYSNMKLTKPITCRKDYNCIDYSFDAFIVGSDQVWRFDYTKDSKKEYFFDFVASSNKTLLSFAASFGIDKWTIDEQETENIKQLLNRFTAVSVREDSGIQLCADHLNFKAELVLDPAFLLHADEYRSLHVQEENNQGKVLHYLLDDNPAYSELSRKVCEILQKDSFTVGRKLEKRVLFWSFFHYRSVYSWINGFNDADFVFTDSFHGVVFSIIFNKPFIAYANKKRGYTRFNSLLNIFGLNDRLVFDLTDFSSDIIKSSIDWDKVNKIIQQERIKSDVFLRCLGTLE
ncbi:polysaccharide pyruvyl transferase family protein [Desulfotalea psychrophila]|uniref:Polysaccharide pyruvyl transferase domain-containing protein n=1 Tax=Desulfotalea psychrophila (strain LSv54 / DSM 12343) TaxID=177439 RepID=Q6AIA5_DESPS|nr:polysaccharide pyruvyl transferase family protein [Desulfotalea psychrophila]CAG37942.1 conserved hypothetical protein [Desulfotalea psychrophila LSv54]